jgi:hypothetical protein
MRRAAMLDRNCDQEHDGNGGYACRASKPGRLPLREETEPAIEARRFACLGFGGCHCGAPQTFGKAEAIEMSRFLRNSMQDGLGFLFSQAQIDVIIEQGVLLFDHYGFELRIE